MLTQEQLAIRKTGVGASEVAAVLGISPWKGPHEVWEEKTGRAKPTETTDAMLWGTYMEPAIIELWRNKTGRKNRSVHFIGRHQRTMRHPNLELALATPDGLVDPDANLEVKSYGFRLEHHWGEPGTDKIPMYYQVQTQWAMGVTGRPKTIVLAEHDRVVDEYYVNASAEIFGRMYDKVAKFWRDHVLTDRPPPVLPTENCADFLDRYYPKALSKETLAPQTFDVEQIAAKLKAAQEKEKEIQTLITGLSNTLKDHIGQAYGVQTNLGKILWYNCTGRTDYPTKTLLELCRSKGATQAELEAIQVKYEDYRVFRPYWKKEKP